MGNGKLTEHAQNLKGCEKCNLRKAVGNLELPYGCEITKSIFIRVNNPTLNNNVGKFNLPHIWDRVLINTPGLKLNK